MTFTPTPKADLQPLSDLYAGWDDFAQQVLSRLHHAEQAADWAAIQIATLFAALPDVLDGTWIYKGTDVMSDPGPNGVAVRVPADPHREFALGKNGLNYDDIQQGSTVVLTDDPGSPPITAFRQYTVTTEVVDVGPWITFDAVRIATFGVLTTPPVGSSVRLILR